MGMVGMGITVMSDDNDIEDVPGDLKDAVEAVMDRLSDTSDDELPEFGPYQMVESFGPEEATGTIYTGPDGDIWFDTEREDGVQTFGQYEDEFLKAILRAYLSDGE